MWTILQRQSRWGPTAQQEKSGTDEKIQILRICTEEATDPAATPAAAWIV